MQEACRLSGVEKQSVASRISQAQRKSASQNAATDHYRLLGLAQSCTTEEARRPLPMRSKSVLRVG